MTTFLIQTLILNQLPPLLVGCKTITANKNNYIPKTKCIENLTLVCKMINKLSKNGSRMFRKKVWWQLRVPRNVIYGILQTHYVTNF